MRRETIGDIRCYWSHGENRHGAGNDYVMVYLHGFAAPLLELATRAEAYLVPESVRVLLPESPITTDIPKSLIRISGITWEWQLRLGEAHCWWPIDTAALEASWKNRSGVDRSRTEPEGLPNARDTVASLLDRLKEDHGVDSGKVILAGHSQGAQLAMDFVLSDDRPLAGCILTAPTYVAQDRWQAAMPKRKGLPILLCHGQADPLLPFHIAERLAGDLKEAGLDVYWAPHRAGHELSNPCIMEAMALFLFRYFGDETELATALPKRRNQWQLAQMIRISEFTRMAIEAGVHPHDQGRPQDLASWSLV